MNRAPSPSDRVGVDPFGTVQTPRLHKGGLKVWGETFIEGELSDYLPAELLRRCGREPGDCILLAASGAGYRFRFEGGQLVAASRGRPGPDLRDYLLRQGAMSLKDGRKVAKKARVLHLPFALAAQRMGLLEPPRDLMSGYARQVVLDFLAEREGRFFVGPPALKMPDGLSAEIPASEVLDGEPRDLHQHRKEHGWADTEPSELDFDDLEADLEAEVEALPPCRRARRPGADEAPLLTRLEAGLLRALTGGPLDGPTLAERVPSSTTALHVACDGLAGLGLIRRGRTAWIAPVRGWAAGLAAAALIALVLFVFSNDRPRPEAAQTLASALVTTPRTASALPLADLEPAPDNASTSEPAPAPKAQTAEAQTRAPVDSPAPERSALSAPGGSAPERISVGLESDGPPTTAPALVRARPLGNLKQAEAALARGDLDEARSLGRKVRRTDPLTPGLDAFENRLAAAQREWNATMARVRREAEKKARAEADQLAAQKIAQERERQRLVQLRDIDRLLGQARAALQRTDSETAADRLTEAAALSPSGEREAQLNDLLALLSQQLGETRGSGRRAELPASAAAPRREPRRTFSTGRDQPRAATTTVQPLPQPKLPTSETGASPPQAPATPPRTSKTGGAPAVPAGKAGTLIVNAVPYGLVRLGGRELGETPLRLQLPAGEHDLVVYREGYRPQTRRVRVEAGRQRVSAFLLEAEANPD